ncbi:hypothetical protein NHX12_025831 [Muraenolepis orangiensis]|uniref:Chromogranin-A n=1 Tax=Muraenolepis orangiensis TaxID=630683 RepID=A0A9Q0IQ84_9TELE|nr:hypothetical protein NHX12_025831 [Muraenolepis orangiensis]
MIGPAAVLLVALSTRVLSLPVTSGELENEDVKVMKCIVEALADVLSKPHPVPVSEECLETLRTDDRLFSILRHHNFLKEMQDIAVSGANKRAQLQSDIMGEDQVTQIPQRTEDAGDQSMLEALGGPALLPHGATAIEAEEEDEEEEAKRGADFARWSLQTKRLPMKKKNNVSEREEHEETSSSQQEVPHHSKEAAMGGEEEEEEQEKQEEKEKEGAKRAKLQKSREEKELRTMALRKAPEEEGSAIRKSEVRFPRFPVSPFPRFPFPVGKH